MRLNAQIPLKILHPYIQCAQQLHKPYLLVQSNLKETSFGLVVSASEAAETEAKVEEQVAAESKLNDEVVASPISGESKKLTDVNDPVFSTLAMGNGAAVVPTDGTIYAPVDGELTVAYETKHAYGLKSDNGAEVLIHVGIDTVNLKGQHFESFVKFYLPAFPAPFH